MSDRVKTVAMGEDAWRLVLDAGAPTDDGRASAWAELRSLGLADRDGLTPLWRDVAAGMGSARRSLDLTARSGERQMVTRIWVLRGVSVLATRRRTTSVTDGVRTVGREDPVVRVQVAAGGSLWDAVERVLPPDPLLRAPAAAAVQPLGVVGTHAGVGGTEGVGTGLPDLREAPADDVAEWQGLDSARGEGLVPKGEQLRVLGAWLEAAADDLGPDPSTDDLWGLLGRSPLDDRLVDLMSGEADDEVTLLVQPHGERRRPSAEDPLAALGGLEVRTWRVSGGAVVCTSVGAGGVDVRAGGAGALAAELLDLAGDRAGTAEETAS